MSLIERKSRPLKRDAQSLRDDRLFMIATDDTYAPKQYFDFFQLSRVKVFVIPTTNGESSSNHVLKRLLEYEHEPDDQLWMLLDTDHYTAGNHLPNFIKTLGEARQKDVQIAVSRPCFDIWLLLHQVEETEVSGLENCKAVAEKFRASVGEFNKTNLNRNHYELEAVVKAGS